MGTIGLLKKVTQKKQEENKVYIVYDSCIMSGLFIFVCFLIYFMLIRAIGLHEVFVLRYLNSLFLLGGILFTIRKHGRAINYKKGLQIGMLVTIIAVIPFSLFLYCYLNIDDGFMYVIQNNNTEIKEYTSPGVVACLICLEGLCCGSIFTFILMQFLRKR